MLCRIKFNPTADIIDNLHAAFVGSQEEMKQILVTESKSHGIPEECLRINNSADGEYFWDAGLVFVETVDREPKVLTVLLNFASSLNERELCAALRELSRYIGSISVEFMHEDDLEMSTGWYKYQAGDGELYGEERLKEETPEHKNPYLNEYFKQRAATQLAVRILRSYIVEELAEVKGEADDGTKESVRGYVAELLSRLDSCNYDMEFIGLLKGNLARSFSGSQVPHLVEEAKNLDDRFYFVDAAVKKYQFRLQQVRRYGLLNENGDILDG